MDPKTSRKEADFLCVLASEQIDSKGCSWIEVIPSVEKDRNGPYYFTVTPDDLQTYATSIKNAPGRISIDYDHATDEGGSSRAAGWFTGEGKVISVGEANPQGVPQRHSSVWAEAQWTPRAQQEIRDGEFRFISPVFDFEKKDAKTGLMEKAKEILRATLTNEPHFTQLAPVTAQDLDSADKIAAYATEHKVTLEDLQRALADVEPDTPLAKVIEQANAKPTPAPKPKPTSTASEEDTMDSEVLKALGLKEDASTEEALAAAVEMREKLAITEGFDKSVLEQLAKTTASEMQKDRQLAQLQRETSARIHDRDREDMLSKATEQGQILPVHKAALRAVYDGTSDGPEKVKAIIDSTPKKTWNEHGSGGEGLSDKPAITEYRDKRGNLVAEVVDDGWLDQTARGFLSEKGKTLKTATAAEYTAALEQARELAARG